VTGVSFRAFFCILSGYHLLRKILPLDFAQQVDFAADLGQRAARAGAD
jgi:hypothetical protein